MRSPRRRGCIATLLGLVVSVCRRYASQPLPSMGLHIAGSPHAHAVWSATGPHCIKAGSYTIVHVVCTRRRIFPRFAWMACVHRWLQGSASLCTFTRHSEISEASAQSITVGRVPQDSLIGVRLLEQKYFDWANIRVLDLLDDGRGSTTSDGRSRSLASTFRYG